MFQRFLLQNVGYHLKAIFDMSLSHAAITNIITSPTMIPLSWISIHFHGSDFSSLLCKISGSYKRNRKVLSQPIPVSIPSVNSWNVFLWKKPFQKLRIFLNERIIIATFTIVVISNSCSSLCWQFWHPWRNTFSIKQHNLKVCSIMDAYLRPNLENS